mmetsp:Transcript_6979/g.10225  ORF Transcript_6979/g.10225 Transcript_6979/m.10225 type:complete len:861 (+) Transcript_6979:96-2678(+)
MIILNVAEKPKAAKKIASILGNNNVKRRDGFSKMNPIWEFDYKLNGSYNCKMIVTSVLGHLFQIDFPKKFENWNLVDPADLMKIETPVERFVPPKMKNIEKTLIQESKRANSLYLWLDGDREGENIAFEVILTCQKGNQTLTGDKLKRAKFSDFSPTAIQRAIRNMVQPDKYMSDSVEARREIDLRIGSAFTRFQTLQLKNKYTDLKNLKSISYGPCQFPTLGFVVRRYIKRKNFVEEPFWGILLEHQKGNNLTKFNWERVHLFDQDTVEMFFGIVTENAIATVVDVKGKPTTRYKPKPMNTVDLQKLASKQLGMSAKKTMEVAESLYNAGIISYPRTETNSFAFSEAEMKKLVENQKQSHVWGDYATKLMDQGGYRRPRNGTKSDNAHPPIHPLRVGGDSLSNEQRGLLELICRHFLAVVSDDARGHSTKVTVDIENEIFHTSGVMITQRNFLEIYTYQRWNNVDIPVYQVGEQFSPKISITNGRTTAPPLLTEADLIHLMDKNGIGTDATMAQHIHRIEERTYIRRVNKFIEPLPLGIALVQGYTEMELDISKPFLRAKMEEDMSKIGTGTVHYQMVLRGNLKLYLDIFESVRRKFVKVDNAVSSHFSKVGSGRNVLKQKNFSKCGKCLHLMDLRTQKGGIHLLKCTSCSFICVLPDNSTFAPLPHSCPICHFQVLDCTSKKKKAGSKTKSSHSICPYCFSNPPEIEDINPNKETRNFRCFMCTKSDCPLAKKSQVKLKKCNLCHHDLNLKQTKTGSYFVGCSNFSKGCTACIWFPKNIKSCNAHNSVCSTCHGNKIVIHYEGQPMAESPKCLFCNLSLVNDPSFSYRIGKSPTPKYKMRGSSIRHPPPFPKFAGKKK